MRDTVELLSVVWHDFALGTLYAATDNDMYPHCLVYVTSPHFKGLPRTNGRPVMIHYDTMGWDDLALRFCVFADVDEDGDEIDFPTHIGVGTELPFHVNALMTLRPHNIPTQLFKVAWKWCLANPNEEE